MLVYGLTVGHGIGPARARSPAIHFKNVAAGKLRSCRIRSFEFGDIDPVFIAFDVLFVGVVIYFTISSFGDIAALRPFLKQLFSTLHRSWKPSLSHRAFVVFTFFLNSLLVRFLFQKST